MLRRNLQRIISSFLSPLVLEKTKCYPWHFTISGYIITSEIVVATPHLQRLSGLLCAVLQHFASTAQLWASEDGLRMINQLISFKTVSLIIVISIADCSHCHLCLRVVLSLAQCQGIGAHWSWKNQGITPALDNSPIVKTARAEPYLQRLSGPMSPFGLFWSTLTATNQH